MICISLPGPSLEDLQQQLQRATTVADLVEFRLDLYDHPDLIREIQNKCSLPFILTLRPKAHGGAFVGNETDQLRILRSLLDLHPEYIDIEDTVPTDRIKDFPSEVKIIRSYHNFKETPNDLIGVFKHLTEKPADLYKIATTAHSTLDALKLLCFAKTTQKPLTVMAMGEKGSCSRILGPAVGCPLTYASLSAETCTAPGQISAHELREIYHLQQVGPMTSLYGLLGDPIHQSIGHHFHNRYMKDLGALYVKLQIASGELELALELIKRLGFKGLSITIPHKEQIIPLLDEVDSIVCQMKAVNTITINEGCLCGSNTDADGALDALENVASVSGKRMVLLGAGGAIRAIAYEAKRRQADLVILNRDVTRAQRLAKELSCSWGALSELSEIPYDILVNGTPNVMPVDPKSIRKGTLAMDLSITPKETQFLKAAQDKGCKIVYGTEMFFRQAEGQARTWFDSLQGEATAGIPGDEFK